MSNRNTTTPAAHDSLLRSLANAFSVAAEHIDSPRLVIDVDGGISDRARFLPVAMLEGASRTVLGSAAIIGERWALTASHCLLSQNSKISLYTRRARHPSVPRADAKVDVIYWPNGDRYRFGTVDKWPPAAAVAKAWKDQIVLLHLDRRIEPFFNRYGEMPGDVLPELDDFLIVAGFGHDSAGDYTEHAQVAVMRYLGPQTYWRGGAYRDRHVIANGSVRSNDSGGPVFLPDISTLSGWHRLIGIHSCRDLKRDLPKEADVAVFLPLSGAVQSWIEATQKRHLASAPLASEPQETNHDHDHGQPVSAPVAVKKPFYWRNFFYCYTLIDASALNNPVGADGKPVAAWLLSGATHTNDIFRVCDEIEILPGAGGAPFMKLIRRSNGQIRVGKPLELQLSGLHEGAHHWFESDADDDGVKFFLFLLSSYTDNSVKRRGIRVEAYKKNSSSKKPDINNIESIEEIPADIEETEVDVCTAMSYFYASGGEEPVQDDEANGYEKPR